MRIRCGLAGFVLSCGCAAGVYETYDVGVVSVIDERGDRCSNPAHRPGRPFALGLSEREAGARAARGSIESESLFSLSRNARN